MVGRGRLDVLRYGVCRIANALPSVIDGTIGSKRLIEREDGKWP
jgi:hypothetical protein